MLRNSDKWFGWTLIVIMLAGAGFLHAQEEGLLVHWKFNESEGTIASDSSNNGNDGTLNNMNDNNWVKGKFGNCLEFISGREQSVMNDALSESVAEDTTIAAWFKGQPSAVGRIIDLARAGAEGLNIAFVPNSHTFVLDNEAGVPNGINGVTVVDDNEWHLVAATRQGSTYSIWIDDGPAESSGDGGVATFSRLIVNNRGRAGNPSYGSGLLDDVRLYTRALSEEEIQILWLATDNIGLASDPFPEDEEGDVLHDVVLRWTPGAYAVTHDIYLGTSWDDVNDASRAEPGHVLISQAQEESHLDPGRLEFDTLYFWRVDEVNGAPDHSVLKGHIWSFTTEPVAYPITDIIATASSSHTPDLGPENTVNGSGLNETGLLHGNATTDMWLTAATDTERWIQYEFNKPYKLHEMWVWNQNQLVEAFIGFGAKDVTIEVSVDGSSWKSVENVPPFAKGPGAPDYAHNTVVNFDGAVAKLVKLTVTSGWGTIPQNGLSEVRFFYLPVLAREPQPADGGSSDGIDTILLWRAGREADTHDVILSSDRVAVEDGSARIDTTANSRYTPATLDYGTEYFWRIDEVNESEIPARYPGEVWRFMVPEYLIIDDFELYDDKEFLEIWAFWADGYEVPGNGALVGHGNIGERTVVYEGRQSMPIHYDNSSAAISEVTRSFDPPMNWIAGHPTTLSLQVRGEAPSLLENTDGSMTVGGSGDDIWNVADDFRFVYKELSGNGSITAKVERFDTAHDWGKAGVMIRESLSAESSFAMVCTTGSNGTRYQYRLQSFIQAASDNAAMDGIQQTLPTAPVWIKVERVGNAFNGYYTTDETHPNWVPMGNNPLAITMLPDVYIGLAVTSHDTADSAAATFSNLSTTGAVSGAWTEMGIGDTTHPDNAAAPMYLVVTDVSNNSKTVEHPDPSVTVMTAWQEWQIPLNELGLNLGGIKSISIGFGEPGGSPSGDTGTAYIDLLQVGTPLSD